MIKLPFTENKTYYVFGLGASNKAVVKSLKASDADVRVWDDNQDNLKPYDKAMICPLEKAPWSKIKAVVVSPGIAPNHPVCEKAMEKNVPVICDIDLYAQSNPTSKVIGVTGTNGKSTTVALINHILNQVGISQIGGNFGVPVMDLKLRVDYTVLELSSYQLERSPNLSVDVAVLLNITPDHLEWHGEMDDYVAAKAKLFSKADVKIISVDDEYSESIFNRYDDATPLSIFAEGLPVQKNMVARLKGDHNLQNMLAAYGVCASLGVSHDDIIKGLQSFEGLPHRQYLVRVINGVPYINDSKATNADATRVALMAYRNIVWLVGGQAKTDGIDPVLSSLDHVIYAVTFGAAADDFYNQLSSQGMECEKVETVEQAVHVAHKIAMDKRGEPTGSPTVLLSPACASFDQYKNFEERGDDFVRIVDALDEDIV